jgi:hypothetical protein
MLFDLWEQVFFHKGTEYLDKTSLKIHESNIIYLYNCEISLHNFSFQGIPFIGRLLILKLLGVNIESIFTSLFTFFSIILKHNFFDLSWLKDIFQNIFIFFS